MCTSFKDNISIHINMKKYEILVFNTICTRDKQYSTIPTNKVSKNRQPLIIPLTIQIRCCLKEIQRIQNSKGWRTVRMNYLVKGLWWLVLSGANVLFNFLIFTYKEESKIFREWLS